MRAMSRRADVTSGAAIAHDVTEEREEGVRLETGTLQTRADRLVPLPENVLSLSVARRSWNGVCLDVISAHCAGRVAHHLCYDSHTRVAALLEEVGSPATGYDAINEAVEMLLASLPAEFVFTAQGPAVGHHGIARLRWAAGPANGPAAVTGTDVAHVAAGRIQSPYVLLDSPGA